MGQKNEKIMIVEDDSFVMDIYRTKLSQEGYEVTEAMSGAEAIKKLKVEIPSLILLDIIMPQMDGLQVLQWIKNDKRLKPVPVILLTNLSQKEEVNRGIELGASDYLIKSHFTPSEVVGKIKQCLEKNKSKK